MLSVILVEKSHFWHRQSKIIESKWGLRILIFQAVVRGLIMFGNHCTEAMFLFVLVACIS
jgi:hypothetical protein